MGAKIEIRAGQVYKAKSNKSRRVSRRVIEIIGDMVFYSIGADRNYCCKRVSFLKWGKLWRAS